MATRTQREQNEAIDRHERDTLHTLIEEQVQNISFGLSLH